MVNTKRTDLDAADSSGLDRLAEKIERLELTLSIEFGIKGSPEGIDIKFENDRPYVGDHPYVDPRKFAGLDGIVNNLRNEIKEVIEKGGILLVHGPHGSGKSAAVRYSLSEEFGEGNALVRYLLNSKSNKGKIDFVVELNGKNDYGLASILKGEDKWKLIEDLDERIKYRLMDILQVIEDILKSAKTVYLYDPSGIYENIKGILGKPLASLRPGIVEYVEKLVDIIYDSSGKLKYKIPIIIVLPEPMYNILSDEAKKKVRSIRLDLSNNEEFLKEIIAQNAFGQEYKSLIEDHRKLVDELSKKILKYNEGRLLMARVSGEKLGKMIEKSEIDTEKLVRDALEDVASLYAQQLTNFLGVYTSKGRIKIEELKAYARIIREREKIKSEYKPYERITNPDFLLKTTSESVRARLGYEGPA
ncbi:MAG: hypothetical protein ACPLX8_01910, partial [Nanopusillaceae archaeon]